MMRNEMNLVNQDIIVMKQRNYKYTFNRIYTLVNPIEIIYAYSEYRICYLIMKNGEIHKFYKKLDELEKELNEILPEFVRIRKRFIVNRYFINSYNRSHVTLKNGKVLPIGKDYYKQMQQKFLERYVITPENDFPEVTNEEYRAEFQKIFESIDDNRILRYFYIFITDKLRRTVTETV